MAVAVLQGQGSGSAVDFGPLLRHGEISASSALLDPQDLLGSLGASTAAPPACLGSQGDGGTGSDVPAVPCLPELPSTSAPCQAAAARIFSSISFISNCLLQASPNSPQDQEGAPLPRLCRGDLGSTPREGLYQRSCELRSSRASAPGLDWEQSPVFGTQWWFRNLMK